MAAVIGHHLLLGAATAALLGAGVRTASLAAPGGLERVVAAVVLAAAAAAIQALGLGLLALGSSPVALTLAAGLTWAAARRWIPAPRTPVWHELLDWWRGLGPAGRAAAGALAGVFAAWTGWEVAHPVIGQDGVMYHFPEIVRWVQEGTPGSVEQILPGFPIGNYPVAHEVLLTWAMGIARSFAPAAVSPLAALALAGAAGWTGLRALRVPPRAAALALAALLTTPLVARQLSGPNTDLPALAWLLSTAALCAASARRPGLLAPAVVAAGLAVGTKTTTLPLSALLLAAALWTHRRALARYRTPLAVAALAAAVVGATWYVRNLAAHGSPFWPFMSGPWGDPVPELLRPFTTRFIAHPGATLQGRTDDYLGELAGAFVLLAGGALAAPLIARNRRVALAAAATGLSILLWAAAPFTGLPTPRADAVILLSVLRYLLPGIAAGALALALSTRGTGRAGAGATGLLAVAVGWNLGRLADLGVPLTPPAHWLAAGVAAGALAGLALGRIRAPTLTGLRAGALGCLAGLALVPVADGYVRRHAATRATLDHGVAAWLASQTDFQDGAGPVVVSPLALGVLAGDRLRHPQRILEPDVSCAELRARARGGWVVVMSFVEGLPRFRNAARCLARFPRVYDDGSFRIYRVDWTARRPGRSSSRYDATKMSRIAFPSRRWERSLRRR